MDDLHPYVLVEDVKQVNTPSSRRYRDSLKCSAMPIYCSLMSEVSHKRLDGTLGHQCVPMRCQSDLEKSNGLLISLGELG